MERLDIVKKKRIMFFIYQMGGGGAARTLLNIVNNIDRTKFMPVLVTLNYDGSYEKYINDDVKFIKLETKRLRSAILPLSKVIREQRIELVFSTIPNYNIIALLATMLSFTSAKNVVREAAYLGGGAKENIKLRFAGQLYRRASKVIALSKGVKKNIINRYKVNSDKIDIIYNPVDIKGIRYMMERDEVSEVHKEILQSSGKTIITAGRLHPDKDQKTLLKAFKTVKEGHDDIQLFILGEGELEKHLKQLSLELNIGDSVHFAGFQHNPYAYFKYADLFVLSSVREGFGHVLTEAMATGTPVVSTKARPGAEEVLAYGEYGYMCEPSDAAALAAGINHIFALSDSEREDIIEKSLKRAEEFHVNKITRQYEQMFTEVLGK